ncbi:DUF5317 domain-containing protein [Actinotalea sp. BY-33]|uniref:DUF5317 domain-containing protein n=1 Tax=Actinotalea soli TaxID=2819234 RepID=A0A939RUI5_9CELL|nr:DUF5317 domain-containing protein [Actinotalea soli]MBO1752694.1 DUF5317 domain-containing protein [Actinotalea soli]
MLLAVACLVAVLSPLLVGRWPAGLVLHRWRRPWLVWVALLVQSVALTAPLPRGLVAGLHVATYGLALVFLWTNRQIPGVLLVGLGTASNALGIAVNGGVLPASPEAAAAAGRATREGFSNTAVLDDPRLPWLGDVVAWPAPLPLANTASVGDVLVLLGVVLATWSSTRRLGRPAAPPGPRSGEVTAG